MSALAWSLAGPTSPGRPRVPGRLPARPLCVLWFWELTLSGFWVPWAGMA